MLRWIANWAEHYVPTPEKQAEKALSKLRLELFNAELQAMETQMNAEHYRARLTFFEEVSRRGIEPVSDQRRAQQEAQALRTGPKLTTAQ